MVNNQISVPLQALQNANDVMLYISDESLGEQFVVHFVRDTTDTHVNLLRHGINSQWQNNGYTVVANLRWIFATNSIVFNFLQKGSAQASDYKLGIHTIWYK